MARPLPFSVCAVTAMVGFPRESSTSSAVSPVSLTNARSLGGAVDRVQEEGFVAKGPNDASVRTLKP